MVGLPLSFLAVALVAVLALGVTVRAGQPLMPALAIAATVLLAWSWYLAAT